MNKYTKRQLLLLVKNNSNIDNLLTKGYSYSQIVRFLIDLKKEGLIIEKAKKLELSDRGLEYITKSDKIHTKGGLTAWISSQAKYWKKPIDKSDIYLPKKSSFKLRR